jgi:hypothetical protein
MIYWVFNQEQLEKALAEWMRQNTGAKVTDPQRIVVDFLFSEPVKRASLINGSATTVDVG